MLMGVDRAEARARRKAIGTQEIVAAALGTTSRTITELESKRTRKIPKWYELALKGLELEHPHQRWTPPRVDPIGAGEAAEKMMRGTRDRKH